MDADYAYITWDDGHQGQFPLTELGAYPNPLQQTMDNDHFQLSLRNNKHQVTWDRATDEVTAPFDYSQIIKDSAATKSFLAHYMRYGFAAISNTPTTSHEEYPILQVMKELEIGPGWESKFGLVSRVEYGGAGATNQAFSNNHLELHTDLPYYPHIPAGYLFQCIENTVSGGESIYCDSYAVAREMERENPQLFKALCEIRVPFKNARGGWCMAAEVPIIDIVEGNIERVRDIYFVRNYYEIALTWSVEKRERWYEAHREWRRLIDQPERHYMTRLSKGDLVFIDNTRVFHGRAAFEGSGEGVRTMDAMYLEWSHIQNKLLKAEI